MDGGVLAQLDGARQAVLLFISQYTAVNKVGPCNGTYIVRRCLLVTSRQHRRCFIPQAVNTV